MIYLIVYLIGMIAMGVHVFMVVHKSKRRKDFVNGWVWLALGMVFFWPLTLVGFLILLWIGSCLPRTF